MARKYEQTARAQQQDETRQRIVQAALELHTLLGPSATSLSAVAERAGVQRNTLYRHFPDERALLLACSGRHFEQSPMPDADRWDSIADPAERVRHGLGELYEYYEENERITTHIVHDAEVDPLVREIRDLRWSEPMAAVRASLIGGWPVAERTRSRIAVIDVALGFHTWQSLARVGGMSNAEAAALMARLAELA